MQPAPSTSALFTDLYELTMAQAFWRSGRTGQATFSFFIRSYPRDRGYFVFAGLQSVLDYLAHFQFTGAELTHLRSLGRFDESFLHFLASLRFTGEVRAMAEGTLFFVNEPVIEVTAPIIEAQLAETYLINELNLQSILATKAARVKTAAGKRQVIDFAARRTHGVDAADRLARASYLVGFDATSNVLAGAHYGIPVSGTMAHSFVTSYPSEIDAFRAYAETFPHTSVFLVDTYDSVEGTKKAIAVAREMQARGHRLRGIRLDSGDMAALAVAARRLLDDAGFSDVQIIASGGLDEFEVAALVEAGAPIDAFGVGTRVGVAADAPWTDCAYKLVAYEGRPVLKLSTKKQTLPGPKQVYRYRDAAGYYARDLIACAGETPPPGGEELLHDVMRQGKKVEPRPSLSELRERFRQEFTRLPEPYQRLRAPDRYDVAISAQLEALERRVSQETRERELPGSGP
jgi:nicotinate phosphoribosyltransferase